MTQLNLNCDERVRADRFGPPDPLTERDDLIVWARELRSHGTSWNRCSVLVGIPRTTLRRWGLEAERTPSGGARYTWAGALVVTLLIIITPLLLMGISVGTCYLMGGAEEARFMFNFWKGLLLHK